MRPRRLLPDRPRPALAKSVNEVLLVGVLVALTLAVTINFSHRMSGNRPVDALAVVLLVLAPLALLTRRWNVALPAVLVAADIVTYIARGYWLGPIFLSLAAGLIIAEVTGRTVVARVSAGAVVLALVVCLGTDTGPSLNGPKVFGITASITVVIAVSALLRARWEAAREWRQRRDEENRRIASEGRLQLARDLHDVLAHSLSVINVQAGVALHLLDDRDRAREALTVIKNTSRETLTEIRDALTTLRGEESAPLTATVGLHDVDRLVAASRASGVDAVVHVDGEVQSLPPRVDIAAYRIVQESLTNVAKHSAARQAHVTVDYRPDAVRLTVVDPGPARAHDGPARRPDGAGHGIKGMQERAAELGGRLSAQRRFDGGFGVEAELPLKGRP